MQNTKFYDCYMQPLFADDSTQDICVPCTGYFIRNEYGWFEITRMTYFLLRLFARNVTIARWM